LPSSTSTSPSSHETSKEHQIRSQQHILSLDQRLSVLEHSTGLGLSLGSTLSSAPNQQPLNTTVPSSSASLAQSSSLPVVPSDVGSSGSGVGMSGKQLHGFHDIGSGLSILQSKLDLLDPRKLDSLSLRIKTLSEEMERLELERKKQRQSAEKTGTSSTSTSTSTSTTPMTGVPIDKIESLWNLMSKWDGVGASIPLVVKRLQSLRNLHEQSIDSLEKLNTVEEGYTAAQLLLSQDQSALEKVLSSLTSNVSVLDSNINQIQNRLQVLQDKLDKVTQNSGQKGKS